MSLQSQTEVTLSMRKYDCCGHYALRFGKMLLVWRYNKLSVILRTGDGNSSDNELFRCSGCQKLIVHKCILFMKIIFIYCLEWFSRNETTGRSSCLYIIMRTKGGTMKLKRYRRKQMRRPNGRWKYTEKQFQIRGKNSS
jgi:hypothetical protein